MIEIGQNLPPGALCDATGALAADLATGGAIWWQGAALRTDETGAVTGWPAANAGLLAHPTDPNIGNGQIGQAGDLIGLQCRDGVHCGLVAMDALPQADHVSLALRYLPPWLGEAKTLITLNTGGSAKKIAGQNYLYLSEAEGVLTLKDDAGRCTIEIAAPAQDAPRLVLFALYGAQLSLAVIGTGGTMTKASATASAPILSGAGHLFIGCRNQRPGLAKTLGGALIADIWLWPGRAVLGSDAPADRATVLAMRRFWLWAEGA